MLIHDPALLRLGRKPRAHDDRNLRLAQYLAPEIPNIPDAIDYAAKVKDFGMLKNDQIGDCTIAGVLHANMIWNSQGASPAAPYPDAYAVSLYEQLCGYKPGDPSTDQGGIELDILKAWRKAPLGGTQLDAFVTVSPRNWKQVKAALYLFGTLYMGLSLPTSAQDEEVWSSTKGAPGTWGGHCVVASAYESRANCLGDDTLTCITWGGKKKMTRAWLSAYCDELYALLPSAGWVGPTGEAPNHLNMEQLRADLASV